MAVSVEKILDNRIGQIFISLILGLGIAALFHRSCKDGQCIIYRAPEDMTTNVYKEKDKKCVKFKKQETKCNNKSI